MPAIKHGFLGSINRNQNATFSGTPAWIPIPRVRDFKESRAPSGTPDTSDRTVQVYSTIPVRKKYSVEFDAGWDGGAGLTALRTAFLAGGGNNQSTSKIDLAILDMAPTTGGTGVRGMFCVPKFNLDFPLAGDTKLSTMLMPYGNWATGSSEYVQTYTDATAVLGTAETMTSIKLGKNSSVNNSSTNPIYRIRDWKLDMEWATTESGDRQTEYETVLMHQLKVSAELNFLWDASDTNGVVLFRTAFYNNAEIELWLLDGPYATSGSWGIHASFAVTDFPKDNPLTDNQKITCKIEPFGGGTVPLTFVTI